MNSEIITIGNEILIGQVIDSNSAWIGEQLNLLGIDVFQIKSISDNARHIKKALEEVDEKTRLVIVTGGLGPTNDDITKNTVSEYFKKPLEVDNNTLQDVITFFETRNRVASEVNLKQAEIPQGSIALKNIKGTAPGIWLEHNNKIFIFLPGVPFEMKSIFLNEVLPRISKLPNNYAILHKTILMQGIAESDLSEMLSSFEGSLPSNYALAYLPRPGILRLRLTAKGEDRSLLENESQKYISEIYRIAGKYVFGEDNELLEGKAQELFLRNNYALSVAESCTGGGISSRITSISGSSGYFKGSVVAYDNSVKQNVLGVSSNSLELFGAVSEEVVIQMAKGVQKLFNTDFAIATSGIAGPTGGTPQKPVGTIWIAIATPNSAKAYKFQFGNDREFNIERTIVTALNLLREHVLDFLKS